MGDEKLAKLVEQLDADDGFYVTSFTTTTTKANDTLALYLGFRFGGESIELPGTTGGDTTVCLRQWVQPTEKDIGECCREELLWGAVCRYVNTGGKLRQLRQISAMADLAIQDVDIDLAGRYLIESTIQDGSYFHQFGMTGSNFGVHWWEGNYVAIVEFEGDVLDAATAKKQGKSSEEEGPAPGTRLSAQTG